MLRENVIVSGSLDVNNTSGQFVVPSGPRSGRPTSAEIGSLYLEQVYTGTSIARSWIDYNSNQAHYTVIDVDGIYIKNTSTAWIGYFPATISATGNHRLSFVYSTDDSTAQLVLDNNGVNDNAFNITLNATTVPKIHEAVVNITSTGGIEFYLRRNSGSGNITVSNFLFAPIADTRLDSIVYTYTASSNWNGGWEPAGSQNTDRTGFKYRQVINYSYLAGGYKDASPWRNVHKTVNATDQTTHLGELMDYPASYTSGACSKSILFVWSTNTDFAWKSATQVHATHTTGIHMVNETAYAHQSKWDLLNARDDCGTLFQETEFAWIFGGSVATVEKFNLTNETMYTTYYPGGSPYITTKTSITSSLGASGFSDENYGYGYGSESGNKLYFANDTFTTNQRWGNSGQQKGISSKWGKGYAGNEGDYAGGYNLRRWDVFTETNIGNVPKPHPNCGEENFTMGQDHQYMLGNYDGLQNNTSWKFYYATDSGVVNPTGLAPGVNGGTSSGHCGWRS